MLKHVSVFHFAQKTNDQMPAPKRSRAKGKTVARSTPQLRSLQPSHDDLRSGAFDFVQDGESAVRCFVISVDTG